MRCAFCLYGLVGTSEKYGVGYNENNLDDLFKSLQKNVIEVNPDIQFDFFIHTWSFSSKEKILNLYRPKKLVTEKQKYFFSISIFSRYFRANIRNIIFFKGLFKKNEYKLSPFFLRIHSILSRWYSTSKSLILKEDFEKSENFNYDLVISSRIDLYFLRPIKITNFKSEVLLSGFNEYHTQNKFSTPNSEVDFGIENKKLCDLFVVGKNRSINKLKSCFKNVRNSKLPFSPHQAFFECFSSEIINNQYQVKFFPGVDFCVGRDIDKYIKYEN